MSGSPARVQIRDLGGHEGRSVLVRGWHYTRRSSRKPPFLQMRDGTGIVHGAVSLKDAGQKLFQRAGAPGQEASPQVEGTARADARAPGGCELEVR
ncbi:MAG: asparagine--tRNA ligase, partial [Planctomycetota bacterium]